MSTTQKPSGAAKSAMSPTSSASPTAPIVPSMPTKPILPENSIGVRELKNNLTRIVNIVGNTQKEYVVTVHGQPVAVLRPYTEEDAIEAWEKAADQEIAEMLETAKRVSAAWKSEKTAAELLEEMRQESSCR